MKKLRTQDAVGRALCHDITAITDGKQGPLYQRGHVLRAEDVEKLMDIGKAHVLVWDPEADEVHEEEAAQLVTEAAAGPGVSYSGPSQGKFTLRAETGGLLRVNGEGLLRLNRVPDYTVASLPDRMPVKSGAQLAGVRIVPLVTARNNVAEAVRIAQAYAPLFQIKPYRPLKVGIIITGGEIYYGRRPDAFEPVLRSKLSAFGADILGVTKCPDELPPILDALSGFMEKGAELVLFTGGMSVDPDDLTPAAIRQSGAVLVAQGMPMQPGNMLTIAYLGDTPLIGIPSAAIHAKTTSLDIFLPRIFAGERILEADMRDAGEGGFCLNCEVCHYPICFLGRK
ncbi:MAG TPA: molybdopterin-binding protein [Feifaniaceae bacterium]|nr:molybdopterin-binding protein [Feifaniaceae bacterium]